MSGVATAVGVSGLLAHESNKDATNAASNARPEFAKVLTPTIKSTTGRINGDGDDAGSATSFYDGPRVAGFNPNQQQGIDMAGALSRVLGQQAGTAGTGFTNFASGANVNNNPHLEANIAGMRESANRDFERTQLPMIQNTAVQDGGIGGTRQGVAQGIAMSDLNQDLINREAGMRQEQTNFDLGQQLQSLINQGNILSGQTAAQDQLLGVGGLEQGQTQAQLDSEKAKFDEAFNRDQELLRILIGGPAGTAPIPNQANVGVSALGGGIAAQQLLYGGVPQTPAISPYIPGTGSQGVGPTIR